jgi:hypothetical protein
MLMRIFYSGFQADNNGIADRRRIKFWAENRDVEVIAVEKSMKLPNDAIVVITSSSDIGFWASFRKSNPKSKVLFDAVDGIHGETSKIKDLFRGFSYVATGRVSSKPSSFKNLLQKYIPYFDAVVCSSPEQAMLWAEITSQKIFDILDFHEEIPTLRNFSSENRPKSIGLLWEGLPYTLHHLSNLSKLLNSSINYELSLDVVSSKYAYRYLGKYGKIETERELRKIFRNSLSRIHFHEWSVNTLVEVAKRNSLAVLPIEPRTSYEYLKAENRLLIMWRLGLPTLTGPLPSYKRLQKNLGIDFVCDDEIDWRQNIELFALDTPSRQRYRTRFEAYLAANHSKDTLLRRWDGVFESLDRYY